jgi:hypothetical protein
MIGGGSSSAVVEAVVDALPESAYKVGGAASPQELLAKCARPPRAGAIALCSMLLT